MGLLQQFLKGEVTAEALTVGGALKPEAANTFIDMVVEQSAFLKLVTVERMAKIKKDLNVLDIANRILVRVAQGQTPTAEQLVGFQNKGKTLEALSMQLFATVLFQALEDNQDNPGYENSLAQMYTKKFANELEDLAFNGTSSGGANFIALNTGYVQLAKDASTTKKVEVDTFLDAPVPNLQKVVAAQDNRYKANSVFVLSASDYEGLVIKLSEHAGGIAYLIQGSIPSYMGYRIVTSPFVPSGVVLFTPLANYVFGVCKDIQRYRELSGRKRCIDYTFDINTDFAFAIDEAVVIGYDVA